MKTTAEQHRQKGIEKQRAQLAEINAKNLADAEYKNETWTFHLEGQGRSWMATAQRMIAQLAEREGVDTASLSICIMLPERGRTYTKAAASNLIVAHG